MAVKLNIGVPSQKKTKQVEVEDAKGLYDKKIGDTFKGEVVDLPGYEFEITGGSDNAGFPMRQDVKIAGRRKVLITRGTGNKKTRKGMRLRKTVAGSIVYAGTAQLNVKAVKEGKQSLFEEPKAEESEEKSEEKSE